MLELDVVGRKLKYHADEYYILGLSIDRLDELVANRYLYLYMLYKKECYLSQLFGFLVDAFILYGVSGSEKNNVIMLPTNYYRGFTNRHIRILPDTMAEEERECLAVKTALTVGYKIDTIDSIKDKISVLYETEKVKKQLKRLELSHYESYCGIDFEEYLLKYA